MLEDLRQYITKTDKYSGQGALLHCFYIHCGEYREYLTSILDGFLVNFDTIAVDVPEILNTIGKDWHIADIADLEWNPYEDPDLIDLITYSLDQNAKGGYYGNYDKVNVLENFVLTNLEKESDFNIAESIIDYIGADLSLDELRDVLPRFDSDEWSTKVDGLIDRDDGEFIDVWHVEPSNQKSYTALSDAFKLIGMEDTGECFWNVGISYGEQCEKLDFDYSELVRIINNSAPYENYDNVEKYEKVFEVFSSCPFSFNFIANIERASLNRKDVLF